MSLIDTAVKIISYISAGAYFLYLIYGYIGFLKEHPPDIYFLKEYPKDRVAFSVIFSLLLIVLLVDVPICIHNFFIPTAESTVISMVLMAIVYLIGSLFYLFAFIFYFQIDFLITCLSVAYTISICVRKLCIEIVLIQAAIGVDVDTWIEFFQTNNWIQ